MVNARRISLVLAILMMMAAIPAFAAVAKRTTPNSFCVYRLSSVDQLCSEITHNKKVAQRFEKQYGMPAQEIVAYFQANLRAATLKQSGTYKVYFVTPSGRLVSRSEYLPAGEKIFVTPSGRPVICARCGNPLSKAIDRSDVYKTPSPVLQSSTPQPELAAPITETAPVMTPSAVAMEPAAPQPVEQVAAIPIAELPAKIIPVAARSYAPLLVGLAFLPHDDDTKKPIPEPSSLLVLAFGGLSTLAGISRFRRR